MAPGMQTPPAERDLNDLEKRLLDAFQRDFPLSPRPYAEIADLLGTSEAGVIDALGHLQDGGRVSRIGAVMTPHRVGWSTLAAMAVPDDRLHAVAKLVSAYDQVNHNYEREHRFNLWFVATGPDREAVRETLAEIEAATGLEVMELPLVESYRLDLGFPLKWS